MWRFSFQSKTVEPKETGVSLMEKKGKNIDFFFFILKYSEAQNSSAS